MIIPSLLTSERDKAEERIALAQEMSGWLHLDILDHTLYDFGSLSLKQMESLDFGQLDVEAHCMIDDPLMIADSTIPFARLIIHYEIPTFHHIFLTVAQKGLETWVALSPNTNVHQIDLPTDIQGIILMGVEPGQMGQEFIDDTYDRLDSLKDYYPDLPITVDGGVNEEHISKLIAHGADNMIMGSAIFETKNPLAAYHHYERLSDPVTGHLAKKMKADF